YSSAPWRTWRGRVHRRRRACGPSSGAPPSADRRSRRCGNTGNSMWPAWWSAIRCRTHARPWLALPDRNPGLAVRLAFVFGSRANQAVVPVLLERVRRPAGHPAYGESGGVEVDRDAQRIVGRSRVEIHVRVQPLGGSHGLFDARGKLVELLMASAL